MISPSTGKEVANISSSWLLLQVRVDLNNLKVNLAILVALSCQFPITQELCWQVQALTTCLHIRTGDHSRDLPSPVEMSEHHNKLNDHQKHHTEDWNTQALIQCLWRTGSRTPVDSKICRCSGHLSKMAW
jgi:hypothetical protein